MKRWLPIGSTFRTPGGLLERVTATVVDGETVTERQVRDWHETLTTGEGVDNGAPAGGDAAES